MVLAYTDPLGNESIVTPTNGLPVQIVSAGGDANAPVKVSASLNALNSALSINQGSRDTMVLHVTGTFVGTIVLEGSGDGTNWVTLNGSTQWQNVATNAATGQIAAPGMYQTTISALPFVRVRMSAYTSGAAAVVAEAVDGNAAVFLDSPLPAGSNTIGSVNLGTAAESGNLTALNGVVGGTADLANLGQVQVQITGTWVGTITFQTSIDGTNWVNKFLLSEDLGARGTTTSSNNAFFGHVGARYFRVQMTAFTSGTAVVTIRYNAIAGEMPIPGVSATLRASAGADGVTSSSIDEVALGAGNGAGTVDRLKTASGAGTGSSALAVATGNQPQTSINAASAVATGTAIDLQAARANHTIQVDVTTTTAGTGSNHLVLLEGSLDGTYFTGIGGGVSLSSTSTVATDASNHGWSSATGPFRFIRARWTQIPTGWVGTLTARVVSA